MLKVTVYRNKETGVVDVAPNWRDVLNDTAELESNRFEKIELRSNENCFPCESIGEAWPDIRYGDKYISEWACHFSHVDAEDADEETHTVFWIFEETKGDEVDADQLNFEEHNINRVVQL